ncbi:MAG: Rrf2 family transcriptional regulator [Verrucomicrobiales bacterium]|nr:Rrf2 family transcriptional regulator [Verrucomicrobiales bacterium]MCP5559922.1 Rrf2 family transcriptional regulator [Verrucomicrobiaceae bacterium]
MKLSLFSDYSLRVLMFAALKGSSFSIQDVAESFQISRNHLVKVVNFLAKLGYLDTRRGRGGGIELGMAPEEIRVGLLVRRTENSPVIVECFDPKTNTCPINGNCRLKGVLAQAVEAYYTALDRYTVRDLVAGAAGKRIYNILIPVSDE